METKTLAVTEWTVGAQESGTLEGLASPYGAVDSYGDTIHPGAYDASIAPFLRDGFLCVDHSWSDRIGYPLEVRSTPAGLFTKFAFHSDPEAQKHRTRTAERMAHGKGVGLSIGYHPDRSTKRADGVRVLEAITLYEVSIVGVPAEPLAQATGVKVGLVPGVDDLEFKPFEGVHACRLREPSAFQAGSFRTMSRRHDGKPYNVIVGRLKGESTTTEQAYRYSVDDGWEAGQARSHCADHDGRFEAAKSREIDLVAELTGCLAEVKEGRQLSAASRARVRAALEALSSLDALRTDLADWLEATEPAPKEPKAAGPSRHRFETDRLLARLRREGLLT